MKNRNISFLIILLIVLFSLPVWAQVTQQDLSKIIKPEKLEHPYLFFTNAEKQKLVERIHSDKECAKIMERLLAEGHRFLYMPVQNPPPIQPKHPRFESGDLLTPYVKEMSNGALALSFLYQITGDIKYAKKGIEYALALSDVEDWVDAAHKFDIIYSRVWPWNVPDDRVVFSYDIMAAGKTLTLSTVYDWLYPALSMPERDKLRNALLEKAITRVRGNYDFFWWSYAYRCNWSAICNSGLGIAALTMLKESPQLLDVVAESYNRISATFDHIDESGGWQEGRGYYVYMMRESVLFMDALKRITNGKYNLFAHEHVKEHPLDFLLYAMTAHFEDSEDDPLVPTAMVNKLVQETGSTTGSWYRDEFLSDGYDIFDIIWPRSDVKAIEPAQKSKLFSGINWAILRNSFDDPSSVTIACKAGLNDDPHHGHLDCGQFILTWHDVPFIRDLGRMKYDELYFGEDRYTYPYASSLGHNVVFVNGEQQIIAKKKNQPWKEEIGGKILDFQTTAKRDYVLMDPTHAYPDKEMKKWRRSIILEKPVTTLVFDEVDASPGSEIKARFFPGTGVRRSRMTAWQSEDAKIGHYRVLRNCVLLDDGNNHSMALIPLVLGGDFKIIEGNIPAVPVTEESSATWIPYIETIIKSRMKTLIIATIILPVNDQQEAEKIVETAVIQQANSDEIEVRINAGIGKCKWIYKKKKDGYTLKN
jgi:Heparinase II/III-like protein